MELVEEYNDNKYTPDPRDAYEQGEKLGFVINMWQWFNYGATSVMFAMTALVTILVLDKAHESTILTIFFGIVLLSIAIGESKNIYHEIKELIDR